MYGVPLLLRNQSNILQVWYNDQIADDMTVQPSSPGPLDKWMELLPPEVTKHVELKKLIIPGSHDSATFDLDTEGGRAGDFSADIGIPDDKMEKWFKTQHMDFTEQLNNGIRYFDLRIIKRSDTGSIHFVHGLHSRKTVAEYLKDFRKFLDEHQKEVVILDFNHIYQMSKQDHVSLCTEIENIFTGIMLNTRKCQENGIMPSKMTLSKLWELSGRVLVLYGNSRVCTKNEHIWPRHEIDILWPYTPQKDLVVKNLLDAYRGLYVKDVLIVWHGILTPHSDEYFVQRLEQFKDLHEFVSPTTKVIVEWLKSKPDISLNILCADFVEEHDFVETVIGANYNLL